MNSENTEIATEETIAPGGESGTQEDTADAAPAIPPKPQAPPERREFPRQCISWRAILHLPPGHTSPAVFGKITEVSPTGMTFLSERNLSERCKVTLAIRMPAADSQGPHFELRVEAVVIHSILNRHGFRCGLNIVKFLAGKEAFMKRLAK